MKVAHADVKELNVRPTTQLPSRDEILESLMATPEFDVLVIGGGATGAGVALDAQSRGEKTYLYFNFKWEGLAMRNNLNSYRSENCIGRNGRFQFWNQQP